MEGIQRCLKFFYIFSRKGIGQYLLSLSSINLIWKYIWLWDLLKNKNHTPTQVLGRIVTILFINTKEEKDTIEWKEEGYYFIRCNEHLQ